MIRTSTAVCFVVFASQPTAADNEKLESCKRIAETAEIIMQTRQTGADVVEMYAIAGRAEPDIRTRAIAMVSQAFDEPLRATTQDRQQTVSMFKSEAMTACMETKHSE